MFSTAEFFDLSGFEYADLFDGVSSVWEAVGRLPEYLAQQFGRTREEMEARDERGRALVRVAPRATVDVGATVLGPALIGPGCRVYTGSLVRGPVILGEGSFVGHGSEVSASVLLNGARVPHLSYVGNSIIGRGVNLGAGSICSNFKLTHQPVKVRAGDAEYDTGLLKLGAILGDEVQVGCHVIMNPGTLIGPRTWVYAGANLRGWYPPDRVIKVVQTLNIVEKR